MKVVSTQEMRRLEAASDAAGHTYADMMECAGAAVAAAVQREMASTPSGGAGVQALVLCGPGNNGGDGLVAARYLQQAGQHCTAYLWKRQGQDPNLTKARQAGVEIALQDEDPDLSLLAERAKACGVLVDALLGTGAKGPLRGDIRSLLEAVRSRLDPWSRSPAPKLTYLGGLWVGKTAEPLVVAVDGPSGLDFDTGEIDTLALAADLTVTFAYPKVGLYAFPGADYVGELVTADIGLPEEVAGSARAIFDVATPRTIVAQLPARPRNSHKGTFGRALVVGGSTNYVGAPCLAAEAAYRVGAGLVTLAVPSPIHGATATSLMEATHLLLPSDMGALVHDAWRIVAENVAGYAALLVGPGLGRDHRTAEFMQALVHRDGGRRRGVGFGAQEVPRQETSLPPLVIDADGLNLLTEIPEWWKTLPEGTVLTPHPGEMARLVGGSPDDIARAPVAERVALAKQWAERWQVTLVLKGAFTVVAAADGRAMLVPYANALLASAGTGDVLAGAILGLLAQGLGPYEAALCAAYVHGLAGEMRRAEIGTAGLLAGDLLALLPRALRALRGG